MTQFVFIDYSPLYYKTIAKKPLPAKRAGKFVQIRNGEKEYLIFSVKDFSPFHANIVERFFADKGIAGSYNPKRDCFTVDSQGWKVIGGGVWAINDKEKSLQLSGSSLAYGKYDRRGLQEKISAVKELSRYTVTIE